MTCPSCRRTIRVLPDEEFCGHPCPSCGHEEEDEATEDD